MKGYNYNYVKNIEVGHKNVMILILGMLVRGMLVGVWGTMLLLDCLAEGHMLAVVNEEGVRLIVLDDLLNARERQSSHSVLPVRWWVNVEVLAAAKREVQSQASLPYFPECAISPRFRYPPYFFLAAFPAKSGFT